MPPLTGHRAQQIEVSEARKLAGSCHQAGRLSDALTVYTALLARQPDDPWSLKMSGLALLQSGQPEAALQRLEAALAARDDVEVWLYLAHAKLALGRAQAAAQTLHEARLRHGDSPELLNQLGALAHRDGDLSGAMEHYAKALDLAPQRASIAANLAAAQAQSGAMRSALISAQTAVDLDPGLGPAWKVLGSARGALDDLAGAQTALEQAVALSATDPDAHYQLGVVLDELGQWEAAMAQHDQALRLNPDFGPALSEALFLRQRLCLWQDLTALDARFSQAVAKGQPGLKPFSWLSRPSSASEQLACARLWADQISARVQPLPARAVSSAGPVRVGYLSSGFHRHPTACLTAEYFECLDDHLTTTYLYSVGPDDGSQLRGRLRTAAHQFHDLGGRSFAHIAGQIRADQIDILVDLRGYGGGAVTEVLAMRPAPIQVNWLAYPGTMGADFMDYIVLDPFVATPGVLGALTEQPVILPNSYQPSDSTRVPTQPGPDRAEVGLPRSGVVYCCFNNSYKYSPEVFATWMAILKAVPDSVLWLLAGRQGTDDQLRAAATSAGVACQRLVFMEKRPHLDYLACYRLANLFLDTRPYNAHTTASDALWAGCPVLTNPGQTFASRVAGSLLHSTGLPQLVVENMEEYGQLAIELGQQPERLLALRAQLATAKTTAPLFDTPAFCRYMEAAFAQMRERHLAGESARPITITITR